MSARASYRAVAAAAWAALVLALAPATAVAQQAADEPNGFDLTLGVRAAHDDNLYRLPPGEEQSDYLQRASAALDGHWQWSRQRLALALDANANRYERNDTLDNTAGRGRVEWDWQAGSRFSGTLGGDYARALASFANTRFREKDIVETTGTFAKLGFHLGPSWTLTAGGRRATTEHDAVARRFDNATTDTVTAGLGYSTSSDSEIGLTVRRTEARFDRAATLGGQPFDRDYEDEAVSLELTRAFSPRTSLEASVGYVRREYADVTFAAIEKGGFEGAVGDLTLDWQASNKVLLSLGGWRRLRAYLDAESDYFVAQGGSLSATWEPTDRLSFGLEIGYEHQDFLGTSLVLQTEPRVDRVRNGELTITYRPLRRLRVDLAGRIEERGSGRDFLAYESQVASLGVRWVY